jgi:hypothetical protein
MRKPKTSKPTTSKSYRKTEKKAERIAKARDKEMKKKYAKIDKKAGRKTKTYPIHEDAD